MVWGGAATARGGGLLRRGVRRNRRRGRLRRCRGLPALGQGVEGGHQRRVVARGLGAGGLQPGHDLLDPVERAQHERDARGRHGQHAVAVAAQDVLGRMRDAFQARQAEEAAGALDRVHEPEDLRQGRLVVRRAFEAQQRGIRGRQPLMRLGQEIGEKVVHPGPAR
jgi:hypothetical protein